jgi:SNF2 family DNA or RNA helicase
MSKPYLLDKIDAEGEAAEKAHPPPIVLTTEMNKSMMARAVPGAYTEKGTRAWYLDLASTTPRAAAVACKLFPAASIEYPELAKLRDKLAQNVRPFDNATPYNQPIGASHIRARLREDDKDLFEFQALDLGYIQAVLQAHKAAYVGWERGLGKTLGTLALIDELELQRVLIVCPNTAKETVWLPDLQHYMGTEFDHVEVLPNTKSRRERVLAWLDGWNEREESYALIVNYEQLRILGTTKSEWKKYGQWDLVVADEAHRIKNPKAKLTRAIKKIPTTYKLLLSGSIISNHAEELFSPLQFMYPDRYRSAWRDWNDRYIDYIEGGFSKIAVGIKIERLEQLREELGIFMVYRRKVDELDLPKRTEDWRGVDLTPSQRKAYDELAGMCVAELDSGNQVAATEGLVMLTKLRQIATGLELVDDSLADSSKLDVALEMIEDNPDEAFVVFSWFKAAARAMEERLLAKGIEVYCVDGDTPKADRTQFIKEFQRGKGRIFVGTIATMGESVNLFRANNAIFLDRSWNPSDNLQAADRIYRIGQTLPVTITHLFARDTVDESRVTPSIRNKEALRALILGGTPHG